MPSATSASIGSRKSLASPLAPAAEGGVVERLAVAVAAARVEQQHGPAAGGELLVVEVDIVGGAVPGVVRAAVDVQQQRAAGRSRPGRGSSQPGTTVPSEMVNSRSSPGEQLDLGQGRAVRRCGRSRRPVAEVDGDDLAERRRRGEHDGGHAAGDRQAGHVAPGPGDHRARRAAVDRHRVQVGAAAVAGAEQDRARRRRPAAARAPG